MKLSVNNLIKHYKKTRVLEGINLEVHTGELLSILGPSGSGKSTLLKCISGLEVIDGGRIILENKEITNLKAEKRQIAHVFQSPNLFPHLSVRSNISFGLEVQKKSESDIQKRVDVLIKLMHIEEISDKYPSQLSGGQQQRVAIARALAPNPSILLMDEPFSGLDLPLRIEMGLLIKKLQNELGLTIIFVTHDVNETLRLSDKIALIDKGIIQQVGNPKSVYYEPKNFEVSKLMGDGNWINGTVESDGFLTEFGKIKGAFLQNARGSIFLRPHQIKKRNNEENYFTFHVIERQLLGREVRYILKNHNTTLLMDCYEEELDFNKAKETIEVVFPQTIPFF